MKKTIIFLLFVIVSCSSNQQKNDLELTILNKELKAYCTDDYCTKEAVYSKNNYELYFEKSNNIIRFKITNNSNKNYLISTYCVNRHCSERKSFPNRRFGLDLHHLQITNEANKEIITMYDTFGCMVTGLPNFIDSLYVKNYNKNGIYDEKWIKNNIYLSEKIIIIPSNETKYFETHVNIPFNEPSLGLLQSVILSKSNKYSVSMIFDIDSIGVRGSLTWSQLKNIKENDYQIYHGTLKSINSVPLKFID